MASPGVGDSKNFEFDYIQARKNAGIEVPDMTQFYEESSSEKLIRKINENPFVPMGVLMTSACLTLGLISMKRGDVKMSQFMMRGRVLAQGLTVAALITGICINASSSD